MSAQEEMVGGEEEECVDALPNQLFCLSSVTLEPHEMEDKMIY